VERGNGKKQKGDADFNFFKATISGEQLENQRQILEQSSRKFCYRLSTMWSKCKFNFF